jgi:hypothetical protein
MPTKSEVGALKRTIARIVTRDELRAQGHSISSFTVSELLERSNATVARMQTNDLIKAAKDIISTKFTN